MEPGTEPGVTGEPGANAASLVELVCRNVRAHVLTLLQETVGRIVRETQLKPKNAVLWFAQVKCQFYLLEMTAKVIRSIYSISMPA